MSVLEVKVSRFSHFLYFIVLLFGFRSIAVADNSTIDSLHKALPSIIDIEEKTHTLLKLANYYKNSNQEQAMLYANQVISMSSNDSKSSDLTIQGYLIKCYIYWVYGDYDKGLDASLKAMRLVKDSENIALKVRVINFVAISHAELGFYNQAIAYFKESIELSKNNNLEEKLGKTYINIGEVNRNIKNYSKALEYTNKGISISKQYGNVASIAGGLGNIGEISIEQKQAKKAKEAINESLTLFKQTSDSLNYAYSLYLLGKVHMLENDYKHAIPHLQSSLNVFEKFHAKRDIAQISQSISACYDSLKLYQEALFFHKKAKKNADIVYSQENIKQANYTKSLYELEQKEEALVTQKGETKFFVFSTVIAALLVIIATILIFFLVKYNREKAVTNLHLSNKNTIISTKHEQIQIQTKLLEQANDKLQVMSHEKDRVIGIVAHDLRSPLNQIKGFVSIINMEQNSLTKDQQLYLKEMARITNEAITMVNQVLDLQAIESRKANINRSNMSLIEPLKRVIEANAKNAKKKDIHIDTLLPERNLTINSDNVYFSQIFNNLISNAIKFSYPKTEIMVRVVEEQNNVIISVKDQGQGIREEDMGKLFKQYQRLSAKPTGGENSTGLGLSIVKSYVELLNGKVWCESEWQKGTTFFVQFPLVKEVVGVN